MAISWASMIADHLMGYLLDQSGIGDAVRTHLRRDPQKRAFQQALIRAFEHFKQRHPEVAASLFDIDFFRREGGPIIEQFLVRNGQPDPGSLALRWAQSLNTYQPEKTARIRDLERASADFLSLFDQMLKAEPDLKEINDSRALEQTAHAVTGLATSFDVLLNTFLYKLHENKHTPGTLFDYLHWLIEQNLYLDPRGIFQTQRLVHMQLGEIYIPLRAQREEMPNSVDRRILAEELTKLQALIPPEKTSSEEWNDLRAHLTSGHQSELPTGSGHEGLLELSEIATRNKKAIILGDPGSGKTTFLRYLALKHAQALQAGSSDAESPPGATCFPLFVRVADYAEYGLPKGKSLSDFLISYFRLHECPDGGLADLLTAKLTEGKCLILLDGLDEIVGADERRAVVHRIEEFVRRYDNVDNHFLITSRVAGYRSAPLGDPFMQYIVQEMDEIQIRSFLERWCIASEIAHTPQLSRETHEQVARREIEGIMHAVQYSPGVRRLAANPLLLRILALIHRTGSRLPQKRIELYRFTAETLASTWRISQGIAASVLITDEYLTPLLSKIAYWLHANKATGIATEREVYNILGEEWANLHDLLWDPEKPNIGIKEDIRNFLTAVREHTGLFVERAPQRYGFMHLTFEEYYAARYLVARSRTRATLIRQHLHDPHWNEPILLALGFVGMESSMESDELLETAILARGKDALYRGFTPSLYEDHLSRDYLFALRCLGDGIPVRPPVAQRLLKRLSDELLHQTGSARFWLYRQALQERLEFLSLSEHGAVLTKQFLQSARSGEKEVYLRASESLKKLGQMVPEDPVSATTFAASETLLPLPAGQEREQASMVPSSTPMAQNNDPHKDEPVYQLLKLGRAGQASPEETEVLHSTLQSHPDPALRQIAAWSLGRLTVLSPQSLLLLLNALHDSDTRVRYTTIISLQKVGEKAPKVRKALWSALSDSEGQVRQEAMRAIASPLSKHSKITETLQNIMQLDPDAEVRYTAAILLGKKGLKAHNLVEMLLDTLQHAKSWSLRRDAALLLGNISMPDGETVIEALWQGLLDDDNEVRAACVEGLATLGRRSPDIATAVGAKLVRALEDPRFEKLDKTKRRSAYEYAFNGLWFMVVSGEVIAEEILNQRLT